MNLDLGDAIKIGTILVAIGLGFARVEFLAEKLRDETSSRITEDMRIENRMENRTGRNQSAIEGEAYMGELEALRDRMTRLECRLAEGAC